MVSRSYITRQLETSAYPATGARHTNNKGIRNLYVVRANANTARKTERRLASSQTNDKPATLPYS